MGLLSLLAGIKSSAHIFAEKNEKSFCSAKAPYIFQQKMTLLLCIIGLKFNILLTNNVVNFEQPGPEI